MLRLYRNRGQMESADCQLMVGAAFSLWRAVFLAHAADIREVSAVESNAADFLKRVIEHNAITFQDDLHTRVWSGGYYINNALYRLKLDSPDNFGRPLHELWDKAFHALDHRVPERSDA